MPDGITYCDSCGKEIHRDMYSIRRVSHHFCNIQCRSKFFRKYVRPMQTLICFVCGKSFMRDKVKHRFWSKKFARICCSKKCSIQMDRKEYGKDAPFRYFVAELTRRRSKNKKHPINVSITSQDLITQWNAQNGKCSYTGIDLILKSSRSRGPKNPYQASLDRIDSSKGYELGNIEFVSLWVNYAKNSWSRDDLISWCRKLVDYQDKENAKR